MCGIPSAVTYAPFSFSVLNKPVSGESRRRDNIYFSHLNLSVQQLLSLTVRARVDMPPEKSVKVYVDITASDKKLSCLPPGLNYRVSEPRLCLQLCQVSSILLPVLRRLHGNLPCSYSDTISARQPSHTSIPSGIFAACTFSPSLSNWSMRNVRLDECRVSAASFSLLLRFSLPTVMTELCGARSASFVYAFSLLIVELKNGKKSLNELSARVLRYSCS